MRILVVVQRFGPEIAGGAEQLARQFALRLHDRGHTVEVLTSCAASYVDWANVLPAGTEVDEGVPVHRLPVTRRRDNHRFGPLHEALSANDTVGRPSPLPMSRHWARLIGPDLVGLEEWLLDNRHRFDTALFCGYMYSPTLAGLPVLGPLLPSALMSVVHDEPPVRFDPVRRALDHAAAWVLLTPEEAEYVTTRFRPWGATPVVGAGLEYVPPSPADVAVLERHGLSDTEYLVCVGRIAQAKGMHELAGYFAEYRRRRPDSRLELVFVGSEIEPLPRSEGIHVTGWVTDEERWALLHGAVALAQPSYFESFSLILAEAMVAGIPSVVQGRNDVLRGQIHRSKAGFAYTNFAEFDAAVSVLHERAELRSHLGDNGRRYAGRYEWSEVLPRLESLLADGIECWRDRAGSAARATFG